jgi:Putative peptidoglycan binding domain
MRILLVLTCSFGLALFAGAAQQDDQGDQHKKKGGQSGQVVAQPTTAPAKIKGSRYNANANFQQPGTTHYQSTGKHAKNWQGPVTSRNSTNLPAVQSTAKGTTFNKTTTINKNITINKNFKVQKFNLAKNPNPKYQAVKFSGNYKIAGAQNWKGAKYQVFVNYQPQWHDQWWWSSHHNHIVFVFGAPYFWDAGYWYPAWGYDPGANYYYDGPIYASNPEMDPGQTVANVQSALQQQGYYQGEIDGILGPQTRAALAEFQSAQGLEPTGAVDEPTLETLGMV